MRRLGCQPRPRHHCLTLRCWTPAVQEVSQHASSGREAGAGFVFSKCGSSTASSLSISCSKASSSTGGLCWSRLLPLNLCQSDLKCSRWSWTEAKGAASPAHTLPVGTHDGLVLGKLQHNLCRIGHS